MTESAATKERRRAGVACPAAELLRSGPPGDDPEALVIVSEVISERTRDSDLDKEQRYDEAVKMAQKAIQTVDTDTVFNPGTPQEKIDAYKALLRSNAYSIIRQSPCPVVRI